MIDTNRFINLTKDYFIENSNDNYGKKQWYKYKKLNDLQKIKFYEISDLIGYKIQYLYRNKVRDCLIVAVSLPYKILTLYTFSGSSYLFDIRINLLNDNNELTNTKFWTSKIGNFYISNYSIYLDKFEIITNYREPFFFNYNSLK